MADFIAWLAEDGCWYCHLVIGSKSDETGHHSGEVATFGGFETAKIASLSEKRFLHVKKLELEVFFSSLAARLWITVN